MALEKIFEYFRKEEVVLWVGSGFSKYAGFPTGKELAETIYNQLLSKEDKKLDELRYKSLPDLTETIVRIDNGSKKRLNSLLKDVFTKKPSSLRYHKELVKIPQIKTIVTTNYDTLLESAYGKKAIKIVNVKDVAAISNKKVIYKIHGDISNLESLIITRSDYADFFEENKNNNLLWTSVISNLLNKVIVFIGYNLEDDNVRNLIKRISKDLDEKRKDIFLIAPGLNQSKVNDLLQMNIQYIDLKGQEFLSKLSNNIKDNIIKDFQKGFVSADTIREYLNSHKMKVELEALDDRYKIKSLEGVGEKLKGKMNFQIETNTEEYKYLQEFVEGKKFGQVTLSDKVIKGFNFKINGINFNEPEGGNYALILSSIPSIAGTVDVNFSDNYEFNDVNFELFVSKEGLELKSYLYTCGYVVTTTFINKEVKFHLDSTRFNRVTEAIKIFEFLKRTCEGKEFKFYIHGDEKSYNFFFDPIKEMEEEFDYLVKYFNKLKEIENAYKIRFTDFQFPSSADFNNVDIALRFASGKSETIEWNDKLEFEIVSDQDLQRLNLVNNGLSTVVIENKAPLYLDIHNRKICLGSERIEILDPVILNYSDLISKTTNEVRISSKEKKWQVSFVNKLVNNA